MHELQCNFIFFFGREYAMKIDEWKCYLFYLLIKESPTCMNDFYEYAKKKIMKYREMLWCYSMKMHDFNAICMQIFTLRCKRLGFPSLLHLICIFFSFYAWKKMQFPNLFLCAYNMLSDGNMILRMTNDNVICIIYFDNVHYIQRDFLDFKQRKIWNVEEYICFQRHAV